MPKSFTVQEKETIRALLLGACRQSWTQHGYKRTSVDALCRQAGISKGAFYLFFNSKESLFCQVLCAVQDEICSVASRIMEQHRDRSGITEALKYVYRAYVKNNFLYDSSSEDYAIFVSKLSEDEVEKLNVSNRRGEELFLSQSYAKCKVDPDMALSVIYALLMSIKNKEVFPYNHLEVFDFMAEQLVGGLFG